MGRIRVGKGFVVFIAVVSLCGCSGGGVSEHGVIRFSLDSSTFVILPTGPVLEGCEIIVQNGEEDVVLKPIKEGVYSVPVFGGSLTGRWSAGKFCGVWTDSLRPGGYNLPVEVFSVLKDRVACFEEPETHTWDTSIGILVAREFCDSLSATFITPTGDYRYLSGSIRGGEVKLSTFDGAHLFHFTAQIDGDSLVNGVFKSGSHYVEEWGGVVLNKKPVAHSPVQEPDKNLPVVFSATTPQGDVVVFSQEKMVQEGVSLMVVDVLGSWCPNCVDEVRLIQGLKQDYPEVAFVSVAFERGDQASALNRLREFKEEIGVDWALLYGGVASKKAAESVFPFLGGVASFPTTVFIPVEGEPLIHTGFNGPATGCFYEEEVVFYRSTIEGFIE